MQPAHLSEPVFARLANSGWAFSQDYWRLVVAAMLATLHVAVFRGVADPWARALLLVHLGLLLLWQPFLRAEQRISPMQGFILSLVAFGVMLALDWWLLAFWVVVLAGLVGGKVYQHHARWQRLSYLVVLAYLLALLAVVILPEIAPSREITSEIRSAAEYLLPLAFVLILLLPAEPEQRVRRAERVFRALSVLHRPAGGAMAAFPRRAAAARSAPGALSRRGAQRPRAPAVGVRRELENRRGERRKRRAHAACRRLREQRSFAAHLLALPPEPGAALAPAPARPAARRVLAD